MVVLIKGGVILDLWIMTGVIRVPLLSLRYFILSLPFTVWLLY